MTTAEDFQSALDDLRRLLDEAPAEWSHWSESDAARPRSDGGWSMKQVVGHLIDSAGVNLQRFLRGQIEDGFAMVYPQDAFVDLGGYQDRVLPDVIVLWTALNAQVLHVLERVPPEKLQNLCGAGAENGVEADWSIAFRAVDYPAHIRHHMKQIRNLQAEFAEAQP